MEERKYTFYDRYQKVKYANITAEEQEVLNISYEILYLICDYPHKHYTFKHFEVQKII